MLQIITISVFALFKIRALFRVITLRNEIGVSGKLHDWRILFVVTDLYQICTDGSSTDDHGGLTFILVESLVFAHGHCAKRGLPKIQ